LLVIVMLPLALPLEAGANAALNVAFCPALIVGFPGQILMPNLFDKFGFERFRRLVAGSLCQVYDVNRVRGIWSSRTWSNPLPRESKT
jgi:hypothetical protein